MTPETKEEGRQREIARQRERQEFWKRHDRRHPPEIPLEHHDSLQTTERKHATGRPVQR